MAQSSQVSLSGTERIRALKNEDDVFQAFDAYPWTKDNMFMSGLHAILGEPGQQNPQASLVDMATHARIFYYTQRIGVSINFSQYQAWLAKHPDHKSPDVLPEGYRQPVQSAQPLDWQQAAPKSELWVDRTAAAQSSNDQPNYPMGFAEMLQLIQEGKPVPGIRQIPNTIIRDPAVKPVGSRTAPRKPWERGAGHSAPALAEIPQNLDSEFPPLDEASSPAGAA